MKKQILAVLALLAVSVAVFAPAVASANNPAGNAACEKCHNDFMTQRGCPTRPPQTTNQCLEAVGAALAACSNSCR